MLGLRREGVAYREAFLSGNWQLVVPAIAAVEPHNNTLSRPAGFLLYMYHAYMYNGM